MFKSNPGITVILGAGASAPTVPTAQDLTRLLFDTQTIDQTAANTLRRIYDDLITDQQRSQSSLQTQDQQITLPTFEDIIGEAWARHSSLPRGHLSQQTYVWAIHCAMKAIFFEISVRAANATDPPLRRVLETIGTINAPLTVATLNWDDLPLQCDIGWFDGFRRTHEPPWYFESDFACGVRKHRHRLLWLHGSPHIISSTPLDAEPWRSVLQWDDRKINQNIYEWSLYIEDLSRSFHFDAENSWTLALPVIVGTMKPLQMFRQPLLAYWSTLSTSLHSTRSIIAIGYRGGDSHLNSVIVDALRHSHVLRRIIWINRWDRDCPENRNELGATLRKVFGWQFATSLHQSVGTGFRSMKLVGTGGRRPVVDVVANMEGMEQFVGQHGGERLDALSALLSW